MSLLGDVHTIADEHPTSSVIIMGDWNSNVISGSVFGRELENFCTEYKYIISDMELLGRNSGTFTFYSESHHVTTWIDHCVCSWQAHTSISDINILCDIQCSDHFPMSLSLNIECIPRLLSDPSDSHNKYCNWSQSNDQDKTRYNVTCNNLLSSLDINNDAFTCDDVKCTHIDAVTNLYNDVTRCLNNAASCSIPQTVVTGTHHHTNVPGWNEYVKGSHDIARDIFKLWVSG